MNGDFLLNLSPFALLPPLRMYLFYLVDQISNSNCTDFEDALSVPNIFKVHLVQFLGLAKISMSQIRNT